MSALEELATKDERLSFYLSLEKNDSRTISFHPPVKPSKPLAIFDGIEWLSSQDNTSSSHFIYVENDLSRIKSAMSSPFFLKYISSSNASIVYTRGFPCKVGGKSFDVFFDQPSCFFQEYVKDIIRFQALHLEGKNLGLLHLKNAVCNLLKLDELCLITTIKGLQKASWIVIGAAPLSSTEVSYLNQLKQTHWLISAGSATKNLLRIGITPDFATVADPAPSDEQYIPHSIPTFFQLRAESDTLLKSKGIKILAGSSGLYPIESTLLEMVDMPYLEFDGGFDTVNFSVAIAQYFEATSINFVGVSDGRGTMNDLLSRMELDKQLNQSQTEFKELPQSKKIDFSKVVLKRDQLINFLTKTVKAQDIIDLDRLGWVDGYVNPMNIYREQEPFSILPLQEQINEVLKKLRD